jgi:DNA-binding MarR family transcriptional regulator
LSIRSIGPIVGDVADISGVDFARLVMTVFDDLVGSAQVELARSGHQALTVSNEFAMQAIDAGADSAADLARALGVSRQAAAKTIEALEHAGYVARTADAGDARRKRVVVSDRGREAIAIGAAGFDAAYRRWRRTVGDDSADAAIAALRAIG